MNSKSKLFYTLMVTAITFLPFGNVVESSRPYTPVHPDPVLEPWRWNSFPELKGMGLQCKAEDKDGNMWFGVKDGVVRYDGVKWTSFIPESGFHGGSVTTLCVTRNGAVFAGTDSSIVRFGDGSWERVFPPNGNLPWPINDLLEGTGGSLWAGTSWGALRLENGTASLYTTAEVDAAMRTLVSYVRVSVVPDTIAAERS